MTSIYITSKKRLDSRWLLLIGVIILVVLGVGIYLIASSYLTPKNQQKTITESKQSATLDLMKPTNSSQSNQSTDEVKKEVTMESAISSQTVSNSNSTTSEVAKPNPMPEKTSASNDDIMPKAEPNKPTLSMEEILKQTGNSQSPSQ